VLTGGGAVDVVGSVEEGGFGRLREAALAGPAPFELSFVDAGPGQARLLNEQVGGCLVGSMDSVGPTAYQARRTPAMIRRSDPELVYLALSTAGLVRMSQERAEAVLYPGQMTIYHTSRPYNGECRPAGAHASSAVFVAVARAHLPTRPRQLHELTATVLRVPDPVARLVGGCLRRVAADAVGCPPASASNVDGLVVDLIAMLLAAAEGSTAPVDPRGQRRMLLLQAKAHIGRHLCDPTLSPPTIAAALHVSLRTLYRAFDEQEQSVAIWIQRRRLERCRRDLADPAQAATPYMFWRPGGGSPTPASSTESSAKPTACHPASTGARGHRRRNRIPCARIHRGKHGQDHGTHGQRRPPSRTGASVLRETVVVRKEPM
jgi:AraC-like DNA-binding protein